MSSDRQSPQSPQHSQDQSGRRGGRRRGGRSGGRGKKEIAVPPQVSPEAIERLKGPLEAGDFIVFDIETTGGNPEKNGITEIFAIKYRGGEILGTFYSLVNPGIPIPPIVRRMTGIDNKMVRNAPRIDEVMPDFVKFVGTDIFVSHNTIGDMKFVRYFAKQACGVDLENFYLCTHLLVEKLASEAPDKSLRGLAEFFDLARGELHRAEADAYVTLELFKVLLGRLKERSVKRIDEAVRLQGDLESGMRLGWGVSAKVLDEVPTGPGVFYLYDHERRLLFLSSAMYLEREVERLRAFTQLPRQLLRLVLKSAELETEISANAFAAMLLECDVLKRHAVPFSPVEWHQRNVQAVFLTDEPGGLRLAVGPMEAGTKYAWGPVRDRRIAGELIEAIGAAYGVKVGRHGLVLPHSAERTLKAFFDGQLGDEVKEVQRQRRAIKLWFKPRERQDINRQANILRQLVDIKLPARLAPLLDRTGLLLVPDLRAGGWQAHSILGSLPVDVTALAGELETHLQAGATGRQLGDKLRERAEPRPLSADEVNRANAVLWWLFNARGDSRFVPVGELV